MSSKVLNSKWVTSSWPGCLVVLLAIGAFFWVVGPLALNPANIAWLAGGSDPTQHYLGWAFFRQSPWSFPLGLNPAFGMDIGSSIVYSDSIPLLAFAFKPFASFLPETFQYFGMWLLLCFILQGYFAWRLLALLHLSGIATVAAAVFMIFSPPMFWRIGMHAALVGHWLLLAALYFNFRSRRSHRFIYWTLLVVISTLVHFYLLTMVLGLCIASLIDDLRFSEKYQQSVLSKDDGLVRSYRRQTFLECCTLVFITLLVMWQAGYFAVSSSATATQSYGVSRMNLLAPIDSHHWSYWLHRLPDTQGALSDIDMTARNYENMMYWGTGVLLMMAFAIAWYLLRTMSTKLIIFKSHFRESSSAITNLADLSWGRHGALYTLLIIFSLFAFSNQLAVGSWSWEFPLPDFAYQIASMYRASSRFFWPAWYSIVFLVFAYLGRHLGSKQLISLMVICATVQISDTRAGWSSIRNLTMRPAQSQFSSELRDPFWESAGTHYKALMRIPVDPLWVKVLPAHWSTFAAYAAKYNLQTNSTYLARQSVEKLTQSNSQLHEILAAGQWNLNTLYILSNEEVRTVLERSDPQRDLLATINSHIVFAPGWLACSTCAPVPEMLRITPEMVQIQMDQVIGFDALGNGKYFLQGSNWAYPESWGIWAVGQSARLTFPLPANTGAKAKPPTQLILEMRALVNSQNATQEISIAVNGQKLQTFFLNKDNHNQIVIPLGPQAIKDGYVELIFDLPGAKRPKDIGIGNDERLLSIGLIFAQFY